MIDLNTQMAALLLVTATENASLKGDLSESLPYLVVSLHAGLTATHRQMSSAYPAGPEVCEQLGFDLEQVAR